MSKQRFNDRVLRSIVHRAEPGDYRDADLKGFGVRVAPGGSASWVMIKRFPGSPNPTRRALGAVYLPRPDEPTGPELHRGALTLAEARAKARKWIELIERGVDPAVAEARERLENQRRQMNSFRAVADAFLNAAVKGKAYRQLEEKAAALAAAQQLDERKAFKLVMADPRNADLVEKTREEGIVKKDEAIRNVARFVRRWGNTPISDLKPADAAEAVRQIAEKGVYEAHNAFGLLSRLFSWAIGTGGYGVERSITESLSAADIIGARREPRERVLSDDELRALWQATDKIAYPGRELMRMLILTGQRRDEVGLMTWSEIDAEKALWTLPSSRMKGGRAHEVPLGPIATAMLADLRKLPLWSKGDYVFSTTGGRVPFSGFSDLKRALDKEIASIRKEAGETKPMERWTNYDIRRTARTR